MNRHFIFTLSRKLYANDCVTKEEERILKRYAVIRIKKDLDITIPKRLMLIYPNDSLSYLVVVDDRKAPRPYGQPYECQHYIVSKNYAEHEYKSPLPLF